MRYRTQIRMNTDKHRITDKGIQQLMTGDVLKVVGPQKFNPETNQDEPVLKDDEVDAHTALRWHENNEGYLETGQV